MFLRKIYEYLFLYRFYGGAIAFLYLIASFQIAKADGLPPPPPPPPAYHQTISGNPNGFPLKQTVNGPNGRVTVEIPRGAMDNRFSSIGRTDANLNGFRNMPSQFTDGYGNVARGNVRSVTQLPPAGKIARLGGPLIVTQIATSHLARLQAEGVSDMYSRGFEEGDWGKVANATAKLFDWTGVGGNVNNMLNSGEQQALGDVGALLQQQALAQARQQFDNYRPQGIDPAAYEDYAVVNFYEWGGDSPAFNRNYLVHKSDYLRLKNWSIGTLAQSAVSDQSWPFVIGKLQIMPSSTEYGRWFNITSRSATAQDIRDNNANLAPKISEISPSEAAIISALEQLLNNQQRNNTDLINALQKLGAFPPGSTPTKVTGTAADNTFRTAPFTPLGSNTAQQTQFTVNPDGSVTVSTVQRADLTANTSQAPTRQQVGQSNSSSHTQTQPAKDGSSAEKPDICAQNPGSIMCADMGSGDYTDPVIPDKPIDFNLNPANLFRSDGVCPAPATFELFGKVYQFDYSQLCSFLRMLRPIVILAAMVMAFKIAYDAVKEV